MLSKELWSVVRPHGVKSSRSKVLSNETLPGAYICPAGTGESGPGARTRQSTTRVKPIPLGCADRIQVQSTSLRDSTRCRSARAERARCSSCELRRPRSTFRRRGAPPQEHTARLGSGTRRVSATAGAAAAPSQRARPRVLLSRTHLDPQYSGPRRRLEQMRARQRHCA